MTTNNNDFFDQEFLDLKKLFRYYKKNFLLLLTIFIFFTLITFFYSMKKDYNFTGRLIYVKNNLTSKNKNRNDICTNLSLEFIKRQFEEEKNMFKLYEYYLANMENNNIKKTNFANWRNKIKVSINNKRNYIELEIKDKNKSVIDLLSKESISYFPQIIQNNSDVCFEERINEIQKNIYASRTKFNNVTKEALNFLKVQEINQSDMETQIFLRDYFTNLILPRTFRNLEPLKGNEIININEIDKDVIVKIINYGDQLSTIKYNIYTFQDSLNNVFLKKINSSHIIRVISVDNQLSKGLYSILAKSAFQGLAATFAIGLILFYQKRFLLK